MGKLTTRPDRPRAGQGEGAVTSKTSKGAREEEKKAFWSCPVPLARCGSETPLDRAWRKYLPVARPVEQASRAGARPGLSSQQ